MLEYVGMCFGATFLELFGQLTSPEVRSVALLFISMMSSLFVLLALLLVSLKLRTYWIIVFVARDGPLNGNVLLSGMAIHFKKPLWDLGHI